MDRAQKQEFVQTLSADLAQAQTVVVAHYRGLTVGQMEQLRSASREEGVAIRVAKNRLTKLAIKDTDFEHLSEHLTGPTALAFSEDPVAAAKVVHTFAKDNENLVILGGALGDRPMAAADVKALASMPSLDELRAKLIGILTAPQARIATYTQEPAAKLARVLQARGSQAA